jgi:hypothetical protein
MFQRIISLYCTCGHGTGHWTSWVLVAVAVVVVVVVACCLLVCLCCFYCIEPNSIIIHGTAPAPKDYYQPISVESSDEDEFSLAEKENVMRGLGCTSASVSQIVVVSTLVVSSAADSKSAVEW